MYVDRDDSYWFEKPDLMIRGSGKDVLGELWRDTSGVLLDVRVMSGVRPGLDW
jgi:hypothetical protein